mgnify:CR=1 FL=1
MNNIENIVKIIKIIIYPFTKIKTFNSTCCKSECTQFDKNKDEDNIFNEL